MFSWLKSAIHSTSSSTLQVLTKQAVDNVQRCSFHAAAAGATSRTLNYPLLSNSASPQSSVVPSSGGPQVQQVRSIVKYDLENGARESSKLVLERFTRLHWGGWIRPRAGHNKLWCKPAYYRDRCKKFVFCTKEQSKMLDILVTTRYRVRRYFPDDPLRKYHSRENHDSSHRVPFPSKNEQLPKHYVTKAELETEWYKSMGLPFEPNFKRPMHKKVQ